MKKNTKLICMAVFAFLIALMLGAIITIISLKMDVITKVVITIILIFTLIVMIAFIFWNYKWSQEWSFNIKKSINFYFENVVASSGMGIIVLSSTGKIIWISDFIYSRFSKKVINKQITELVPSLNIASIMDEYETVISKNNLFYKVKYFPKQLMITFKDITAEQTAINHHELEKTVIGELDIDNFQQFQSILSEEEIFIIQSMVINLLDLISRKYNLTFRQYVNGKFILITNKANLDKMIETNFYEFDSLKNNDALKNVRISVSVGFGIRSNKFEKLNEMAKIGIRQSQSRGGDQVTIISDKDKPKYYGSKSEIAINESRTKIKHISQNLKDRLLDPSIQKVIIYGHKFADLDAIGASMAIYEIAKHFDKEVYIQNQTFDDTAKKSINKFIPNHSKIFISPSKANSITDKRTLVVVLDCADSTRVENPKIFVKPLPNNIFIFDHHRISKLDEVLVDLNVYIESTASSTCEIITELIAFNQLKSILSANTIQMLMNGLYMDSNQFQKSTSSKTFFAASLLGEWGAKSDESIAILKISNEVNELIRKILTNLREIKQGYWITSYDEVVPSDVVSMAADEILKIDGRKAAFVIAKQEKRHASDNDVFKLSARGIKTNVQIIAEEVGGGGHFSAAAAFSDSKSKETIEVFTDNVIQAIISNKD
ncbi:MAG: DHH family phosphoesterase [Metamycoplasmataceae bacterium]